MQQTRRGFFATVAALFAAKSVTAFDRKYIPFSVGAQANTGDFGFKYYNVASNVGNFMGIPRAKYPGPFLPSRRNQDASC